MRAGLLKKLVRIKKRLHEVDGKFSDPEILADQALYRKLSKEQSEIRPVVALYDAYQKNLGTISSSEELLKEPDEALLELAEKEIEQAKADNNTISIQIQSLLLPRDPADHSNIYIEIRSGTGGTEAALFAGVLMRMYLHYAENRGWKSEMVNLQHSDLGGYKDAVVRIIGHGAYSRLKFESGVHRVQRVPQTESQGRIHTSTCTIAILPEEDEITDVTIEASDLRIDTYRASGAGGQHVNKTDSAIRITHLPSGTVVECQEERSQHKNRARAMALLSAKILATERTKQTEKQARTRRDLIGGGERSERIRTYNFPQGRVTDHRIGLTLYDLEGILGGTLDAVIDPLINEHQADLMAAIDEEEEK